MNSLNIKAQAFVPQKVVEENKLFDKLECQFVENNKWIFEYDIFENLSFMCPPPPPPSPVQEISVSPVSPVSPVVTSKKWSDIVKQNK